MRQTDENFVSMCRAVQDVLTKHTAVWETTVAFKNQATSFNGLMDEMGIAMESAEIVSTGATDNKSNAELKAVLLAVNLAKRASIYAIEVNNMELHDQLRVTKSTLLRRPDTMTLAKLRDIHTRLNTIVAELGDYGVLPTDLAELNAATDAFDALIARPRTLIVERKGYNQDTIPSLLSALREVLYKMDSLMNIFSGTELPKEYKDARIIVDLGKKKEGTLPDA
jgi:hypothetical protein